MRYVLIGVQLVATAWFGMCCALICYYVASSATMFHSIAAMSNSAAGAKATLFVAGVVACAAIVVFLLMYWMWRLVWVPMRGPKGTRRGWGLALTAIVALACAVCASDGYSAGVDAAGSVPIGGGGMAGDLAPAIISYQFTTAMIWAAFAVVPLVIMSIVRLLVASTVTKSSAS